MKWGQPLPFLYSMHFLAARSSAASCCDHCLEGDHSTGEFALSPLPQPEPVASYNSARSFRPATVNAATSRRVGQGSAAGRIDFADRPVRKRWNFAKGTARAYRTATTGMRAYAAGNAITKSEIAWRRLRPSRIESRHSPACQPPPTI